MKRRDFLKLLPAAAAPALTSCGYFRIDPWHYLVRSPVIDSPEREKEILSKAKLEWTDDGRIRVLYVQGTPYERGYQHGALLRKEVNDNLGFIYEKALKKFKFPELFEEVYERMRPYMPPEYVQEMHGLAHGARLPLTMIHHMHVLPSIGEWSGKKRISKIIKKMMAGELGTSCSNFSANDSATPDKNIYVVRILDWGLHRISKLHKYPLICITRPETGFAHANIGWVGFLGAVSGMNEQGITLGEMGYGNPPNEVLEGVPMVFLLRDVMKKSKNLADVRKVISSAPGTCSFAYLMSDGKTGEAELYVRDKDRFLAFKPGTHIEDKEEILPAIDQVSYGGHYNEKMTELLQTHHGNLTPELFMELLIPQMAMKSNFQNVIYAPRQLQFWVSNAQSKNSFAWEAPYTFFDFGKALARYP